MPTDFVLPKVARNSRQECWQCQNAPQPPKTLSQGLTHFFPSDFDAVKSYLHQEKPPDPLLDLKWFQTSGKSSQPLKPRKRLNADGSVWELCEWFKLSPQWAALTPRDDDLALLHHLNKGLLLKEPLHPHGHSKFRKGTDLWSINPVIPEITTERSLGWQFSKHLFEVFPSQLEIKS